MRRTNVLNPKLLPDVGQGFFYDCYPFFQVLVSHTFFNSPFGVFFFRAA